MTVDWSRMAAPQEDGYDTTALAALARERFGYARPELGWPRWCDGRLELIADTQERSDRIRGAQLDDPRLFEVEAALKLWPNGYESTCRFLDHFTPFVADPPESQGRGSTSGHFQVEKGSRCGVFVTIDDAVGCAEGILHENAHQRLHVMGMDLERHDGTLITNDDQWRYFSPIRREVLRPMSALIHGVYAWIWLSEIDIRAELAGMEGAAYMKNNVPKVKRGLDEIERHVTVTPEGRLFVDALLSWGRDLVARGEDLFRAQSLEFTPVEE
jgi:hypothetical protein